jgi:FAD/FMN-containing dehydrogenase
MVSTRALTAASIAAFKAGMRGDVLLPGDAGYDASRRVYNVMIDRRPALIARCVDVADVMAAVKLAREHRLTVSVRGGGHNVTGFAVCDDGLVIDLSRMKGIRVDPEKRTVRAEGGCTWGDLDHATHAFGLAAAGGIISTTGIAGLTLGGGIGHLSRRCGLSCDNLISADVVTADGRFITAGTPRHRDLLWGLRGGGGNFGVVTAFEYQLHPISTVFGGPVFYPIEQTAAVLRFFREYVAQAPVEMSVYFTFQIGPAAPFIPEHLQGVTMCALVACYTGPMGQVEEVVRPIRQFGAPALDLMAPLPFPALNSMFDVLFPAGLHHYWKADFMRELSDEAIAEHVTYGPRVPTAQSTMQLYPVDGAVHAVRSDETAFSFRDVRFAQVIAAMYPDPADTPRNVAWVREYWEALHPYSAGGAYVNFMMDEGEERIKATYQENYARLVALKNRYDPTNLFHMNQNIRPAV